MRGRCRLSTAGARAQCCPQLRRRHGNDIHAICDIVEQIALTQGEHRIRFDGIDRRLDHHDARFDGLETRLDRVETKVDTLGTQMGEVLSLLPNRP